MQERRTTVRVPCRVTARCRLTTADGAPPSASHDTAARVTNLSQHGLGLLSPNRLDVGQRVAVRFALPHERQEIALDGLVRWSDGPSGFSHQWASGVAFEQVDETAQFCVNGFVADRAYHLIGARDGRPASWLRRLRPRLSLAPHQMHSLVLLLLMAGLLLAVVLTQREAAQLRQNLSDRTRVIQQLEDHHQLLLTTLHDSRRQVDALAQQVSELKQSSSEMAARAAVLADQLEQTRQEYVRLSDDRRQMREELSEIQASHQALEARLQSLPDLRQAMADVLRLKRHQQRQARAAQARLRDQHALAGGNRGYLVRTPPSAETPSVSITVYPPEVGPLDDVMEALVYDP